ncbi:uncharacterized protein Z518_11367 [Rhinocladiella mackenziei CBS 650.93]|uniref:Rhinocladiella mackenziei CBS 650.93 unplaced genomic scaffold supercont1.13, whole genome shotgun sequence n=1 Tax=Rhinocladiella mackenziei CBS 650.93 TaxID=1442369 RepID=A0A0D2IRJ7_9EURO|nr:uncharacterized protein Z518_11367 [Rhinocladiella mackenziei CBS 650.93]KIW99379.1 hypothetical protein Z518_11367 [Rhinocladiella mackenziei CBS 650.93]
MEVLREAPKASSFIPLIEHQSATPASFYSGPPVLHYYGDRSKLIVLEHEIQPVAAFAPLLETATSQSHANGTESNGDTSATGTARVVEDVDVWVTSDKLFLFSNSASAGVSIPYPSISLHAIQSLPQPSAGEQQGLYLQLASSIEVAGSDDTEPESISVTIIPTASPPPATATEEDPAEDKPEQTPVMAMFTALSNCSNLHPDPVDPGDGDDGGSHLFQAGLAFPGTTDGGLPPAIPGSGGWITAENMHEFVDEDGNWIENRDEEDDVEEEGLGPGAGTVRARQEDNQGNGDAGDEADETKWRRTS